MGPSGHKGPGPTDRGGFCPPPLAVRQQSLSYTHTETQPALVFLLNMYSEIVAEFEQRLTTVEAEKGDKTSGNRDSDTLFVQAPSTCMSVQIQQLWGSQV